MVHGVGLITTMTCISANHISLQGAIVYTADCRQVNGRDIYSLTKLIVYGWLCAELTAWIHLNVSSPELAYVPSQPPRTHPTAIDIATIATDPQGPSDSGGGKAYIIGV